MTSDFLKIMLFWRDRLKKLSPELLEGRGLNADTVHYLTHVGLPYDLTDLNGAIEINFYFQADQITYREFKGINYCVIGDDTGTNFAISTSDNQLYAVNFEGEAGIEPVCFVNSSIDKFMECIQLFIEFQRKFSDAHAGETELTESMKTEMAGIDKKSIANPNTWWRAIVDDPIR